MFRKQHKGLVNWIFKMLYFERFVCELIVYVNDTVGCCSKDDFISKTIMYVSWMENEEKKLKVFGDLKFKLNDFGRFMKEYNITVE